MNEIISPEKNKRYSSYDTVVLAGGGVKGFSILGSLHYMWTNNYLSELKTYIGTSIGSVICYLMIIGYSPVEIFEKILTSNFIEKIPAFNMTDFITGDGAYDYNIIQQFVERLTLDKIGYYPTIGDLHKKFGKKLICCTYNLNKDCTEYLSIETYPELPCLTALRMSSSLPFIFSSFQYFGSRYIDGGIVNNLPLEAADKKDRIFVVNLMIHFEVDKPEGMSIQTLNFMYRLLSIPQNKVIIDAIKSRFDDPESKITLVNITIDKGIEMMNFGTSAHENKFTLFSSGWDITKTIFEQS